MIFPPLPGNALDSFIEGVASGSRSGDVQNDFRQACGAALGDTDAVINSSSVDDMWKRFLVSHMGFTFIGNHPSHYTAPFGQVDPTLTLHYDFANNPTLAAVKSNGPTLGLTRATDKTFLDWESLVRTARSGEAAYTGARRVENLLLQSEDMSTTWATQNGTVTGTRRFTIEDADSCWLTQTFDVPQATPSWRTYRYSVLIRASRTFNVDLNHFPANPNDFTQSNQATSGVTLTPEWQVIESELAPIAATASTKMSFAIVTGGVADGASVGDWFEVAYAQAEDISGQADTTASEYVKTTTAIVAKYFPTQKDGSALATAISGLLVEETRTNICLQSEDLTTTWIDAGLAGDFVANQAVAPDGATTADQLIDDSTTGTGTVLAFQSISLSTTTTYTASFYAKQDQLDWVRLKIASLAALDIQTYFDLGNGALGTSGADNDSQSIESVGNGWYRCAITFTTGADGDGSFELYVAEADTDATVDLDGTSSIFIWGAQLEAGAFPTSYIPTVAASVTRNRDDVGTSTVTWVNESAGTFYVNGTTLENADLEGTSAPRFFQIDDGGTNNRIFVYYDTANVIGVLADGGATQGSLVDVFGAGVHDNVDLKTVFAYAANDLYLQTNGRTAITDNAATMASGFTTFGVGDGGSGGGFAEFDGHIAEIRYYNVRKDNQFLEDLSNGYIPA